MKERYLLERRIGTGGMGKVYKARHLFLKTDHAIKVILHNIGEDLELVRRFRQEAVATAAIRHPNIVAVTDFDVINNEVPFLVMEYVEGRTLDSIIAQDSPLPLPKVLEIMEGLCRGVEAAHRQGILHRDLKPLNVLIQNDIPVNLGLKILDFGLAKVRREDMFGSLILAQTRGMIGSPYYMAPEQWSEEEPDARTDIYALGVILYQMLAGVVPFKGPSLMSVMKQHLFNMPAALDLTGRNFPAGLEVVVQRALSKDRALRPDSVIELWHEIDSAARPELLATQYAGWGQRPATPVAPPAKPPATPAFPVAAQDVTEVFTDDEAEAEPTVLENIAELLDSIESEPPAPSVSIAPAPPPVTPPTPVAPRVNDPSSPTEIINAPLSLDADETLIRVERSVPPLPAKPAKVSGKITLHGAGEESDPNLPARLTFPVATGPAKPPPVSPAITIPVPPPPAPKSVARGVWYAVGIAALCGIIGLGFVASRLLFTAPAVADGPRMPAGSASGNKEQTSVLDYYIEVEKGPKVSGAQPLRKGQRIKLHFVGQQKGYLYLLNHQGGEKLETFLTQNPDPATQVTSNSLEPQTDLVFPGGDGWLVPLPDGKILYTVIFSTQPLSHYDFFTAREIRTLSDKERAQVEALRQQMVGQGDLVDKKAGDGKTTVTLSAGNVLSQEGPRLAIFNISLSFL